MCNSWFIQKQNKIWAFICSLPTYKGKTNIQKVYGRCGALFTVVMMFSTTDKRANTPHSQVSPKYFSMLLVKTVLCIHTHNIMFCPCHSLPARSPWCQHCSLKSKISDALIPQWCLVFVHHCSSQLTLDIIHTIIHLWKKYCSYIL